MFRSTAEAESEGFPVHSFNVLIIGFVYPIIFSILLLAVLRLLLCFGSLMVLDVVCGYVLLFFLHIKTENR